MSKKRKLMLILPVILVGYFIWSVVSWYTPSLNSDCGTVNQRAGMLDRYPGATNWQVEITPPSIDISYCEGLVSFSSPDSGNKIISYYELSLERRGCVVRDRHDYRSNLGYGDISANQTISFNCSKGSIDFTHEYQGPLDKEQNTAYVNRFDFVEHLR